MVVDDQAAQLWRPRRRTGQLTPNAGRCHPRWGQVARHAGSVRNPSQRRGRRLSTPPATLAAVFTPASARWPAVRIASLTGSLSPGFSTPTGCFGRGGGALLRVFGADDRPAAGFARAREPAVFALAPVEAGLRALPPLEARLPDWDWRGGRRALLAAAAGPRAGQVAEYAGLFAHSAGTYRSLRKSGVPIIHAKSCRGHPTVCKVGATRGRRHRGERRARPTSRTACVHSVFQAYRRMVAGR